MISDTQAYNMLKFEQVRLILFSRSMTVVEHARGETGGQVFARAPLMSIAGVDQLLTHTHTQLGGTNLIGAFNILFPFRDHKM